jgi:hypothetical protein
MPKFLKMITGDAKPTGSKVMRVHDFPRCRDEGNTDGDNHRTHTAFPDRVTGACPTGTKAVPQLRISIAYDLPADIQQKGQYQVDSFSEENHNPFSDRNDFANVNSEQTMARITNCVNAGKQCG